MRLKLLASLALAIALVTTRTTTACAVEGGALDTKTKHAVVIATGGPVNPALRCSGVLISSNVVLTARHCVSRLPAEGTPCTKSFGPTTGSPRDFWVSVRPSVEPGTHWKNVASWELPEPSSLCGDDIALLVLQEAFLPTDAVPARPVLDEKEFFEIARRRQFGMAGFGATSRGGSDTGQRRSRFDIPVRCVPGAPDFLCDGALEYTDPTELTGGAGPCNGDSGGGAFADGDPGVVFGILSRGSVGDDSCSEGIYERTDVWRWLVARTVLRSTPPGSPTPAWARVAFPDAPKLGDLCLGKGTCGGEAECASLDSGRSFVCARRCELGCGANEKCESAVCVPDRSAGSEGDSGCSIVEARSVPSARASGIVAVQLAALLGVWLRRRRCARS